MMSDVCILRSQYWLYCGEVIVPFIQSIAHDLDFSDAEVRRVIGILEVNCYQVKDYGNFGLRGFFPLASLLSHSCVTNSRSVWDQGAPWGNKTVAATDIKKGEQIFATYIRFVEMTLSHLSIGLASVTKKVSPSPDRSNDLSE